MSACRKRTKRKPDILALRGFLIISVMSSTMILVHVAVRPEAIMAYLAIWNAMAK